MEEQPLPGEGGAQAPSIDRCPRCSCVFIDYFDGDPSEVARRLAEAGALDGATRALDREPVCPDCDCALVVLPYLDAGVPIWRCERCAGAFLTPSMLDQLADYSWTEPPRAGLLSRLMEWWRGIPSDES